MEFTSESMLFNSRKIQMQLRLFPDYFPPIIPMLLSVFDYKSFRMFTVSPHILDFPGEAGKSQEKEESPDSAQYFW